jgi:hypothetical protein
VYNALLPYKFRVWLKLYIVFTHSVMSNEQVSTFWMDVGQEIIYGENISVPLTYLFLFSAVLWCEIKSKINSYA